MALVQSRATAISPALIKLHGVHALVVDDDVDAGELLTAALDQWGARVSVATSAREALGLFAADRPDVIISDIGMPGEDGYSLIRKLRARSATCGGNIPAAALTAYARSEDRARALAAGFDVHVPKPVESGALASAVKTLLRKTIAPGNGTETEHANGSKCDAAN